MTIDIALIVAVIAIAALLGTALLALLSRPRLADIAEAPMISTPPPDLSPAIAGMIDTGSYPKPALTAAVTDLERQGYLSIAQPDKDGPFVLTRRRTDPPSHPDQATLMGTLFQHENTVTIDPTIPQNRKLLASTRAAHEATVNRAFRGDYYRMYSMPLLLLFLLAVAAAIYVLWSTRGANYWIGAGLFLAAVMGTGLAFSGRGMPPRRRNPIGALLLLALLAVAPVAIVLQLMAPAEPYVLATAIGAAYGLARAWLPRLTHEEGRSARGCARPAVVHGGQQAATR